MAYASDERPALTRTRTRSRFRRGLASERGATMVSTSLLSISLVTMGLLVIQSANRRAHEAGAVHNRERALQNAQAAVELAASYYRSMVVDGTGLSGALAGSYPGTGGLCQDLKKDCIPGTGDAQTPLTGFRDASLTGRSDCAGRPCMRPGAIAVLPDAAGNVIPWVDVPMSSLIVGGDPQARVTVWIRNNISEALADPSDVSSGSWVVDRDSASALVGQATFRDSSIAIEQEYAFFMPGDIKEWEMATPDLSYGAGHNNDNALVENCKEAMFDASAP